MYSAKLLEHFQNPRHSGEVEGESARVTVNNPVCGDVLELSARIESGVVKAIRFRAKGCVPSMACGSAVCQLAEGKPISDAKELTAGDLVREVDGVPHASQHAVQLALDALDKLLRVSPQDR